MFSLQPLGLNSEYIESQTSYISRLADLHCVSVGTLIKSEIAPVLGKDYLTNSNMNGGSRFYEHAIELNGLGKQANDFSKCLSELTGIKTIRNLTFLPWQNIIPIRGLFRQSKAWCPICLEESNCNDKQVYEPLIWNFKLVKICNVHNVMLKGKCPYCNKEIHILSRKSRNGYCSYCGCWLGSNDVNFNEMVKKDNLPWDYFIIKNIGDMIKRGSELTSISTGNNIHEFIILLINKFGGEAAFSKHFGIPKSTVSLWIKDKHTPLLITLLKICYLTDVNINDIFSCNEPIILPMPKRKLTSEICSEHNRKSIKKRTINWCSVENRLNDIINDKSIEVPSVREVASMLGCDCRLLYSHYPDLCKKISKRHAGYIQLLKEKRIDDGCKRISEATINLYKSGIYPSRRNVEKLLYPNLFLREKAYQKAWRDTLRSLGTLNESI